jgi:hypothetical protein
LSVLPGAPPIQLPPVVKLPSMAPVQTLSAATADMTVVENTAITEVANNATATPRRRATRSRRSKPDWLPPPSSI